MEGAAPAQTDLAAAAMLAAAAAAAQKLSQDHAAKVSLENFNSASLRLDAALAAAATGRSPSKHAALLKPAFAGMASTKSMEEGELLRLDSTRSMTAAAAAAAAAVEAAAMSPLTNNPANVQQQQQQQHRPAGVAQIAGDADSVMSPFAVLQQASKAGAGSNLAPIALHDGSAAKVSSTSAGRTTQLAHLRSCESGEIMMRSMSSTEPVELRSGAAGSGSGSSPAKDTPGTASTKQQDSGRPLSGRPLSAHGPSRLGPRAAAKQAPAAAGSAAKSSGPGSKVSAFKIAAPVKPLASKVSAAAAATFGRQSAEPTSPLAAAVSGPGTTKALTHLFIPPADSSGAAAVGTSLSAAITPGEAPRAGDLATTPSYDILAPTSITLPAKSTSSAQMGPLPTPLVSPRVAAADALAQAAAAAQAAVEAQQVQKQQQQQQQGPEQRRHRSRSHVTKLRRRSNSTHSSRSRSRGRSRSLTSSRSTSPDSSSSERPYSNQRRRSSSKGDERSSRYHYYSSSNRQTGRNRGRDYKSRSASRSSSPRRYRRYGTSISTRRRSPSPRRNNDWRTSSVKYKYSTSPGRDRSRRSRSRDRYHDRGRHSGRRRSRSSSHSRSRSRARSNSRGRDRDRSRGRGRSREGSRDRSRDRAKNRDRSRERGRSRDRAGLSVGGSGRERSPDAAAGKPPLGRSSDARASKLAQQPSQDVQRPPRQVHRGNSIGHVAASTAAEEARPAAADTHPARTANAVAAAAASDKREGKGSSNVLKTVGSSSVDNQQQRSSNIRERSREHVCSRERARSGDRDRSRDRESRRYRDRDRDRLTSADRRREKQQPVAAGSKADKRLGNFTNPVYCPNPPPTDPAINFWSAKDGCVHDRYGNVWDATTKQLIKAGGPDMGTAGGERAGPTRSTSGPAASRSTRPASPEHSHSKRQRRDSAAGGLGDGRADAMPAAAAAAKKQTGTQSQTGSQVQQIVGHVRAGSRPLYVSGDSSTALTPPSGMADGAGLAAAAGAAKLPSNVLPEELDVDMEIDDLPASHTATAAAAGQQHQQQCRSGSGTPAGAAAGQGAKGGSGRNSARQFGAAAAARKPPSLQVAAGGATAAARTPEKGGCTPPHAVPPLSPLGGGALAAGSRANLLEAGHCNTEYQAVALEALQHNLSTLDTPSFKSSATLELEASHLKSQAAKLAGSHGWDVRALLLQLSSGMKYLEWAHSFAGSGGVGVASISKQQAYKNNLTEAANTVRSCAKLAKQQMVQRASQRKQAGTSPAMTAVDYAFAAVRLLADKLDAVASMNLLFVKTQGFNTTMRNLTLNTSPATTAAVAAATAAESSGAGVGAHVAANTAAGGPGSMAAPAARVPSAGPRGTRGGAATGYARVAAAAGGAAAGATAGGAAAGGDGAWQAGMIGGPSPGESGTQNSASSAIELAPVAAEGSSRANDRADLADGVQDYITLTDHWQAVADANEAYLQKTGRAAAVAAAAEANAEAKARSVAAAATAGGGGAADAAAAAVIAVSGVPSSSIQGSTSISTVALAAAHRVGQLILAVGFEAGLWDLPSVLDIARQAADAIMNLVEVHSTPAAAAAAEMPQLPRGGAGAGGASDGASNGGADAGGRPGSGSAAGSTGASLGATSSGLAGGAIVTASLTCGDSVELPQHAVWRSAVRLAA